MKVFVELKKVSQTQQIFENGYLLHRRRLKREIYF